ncbi:MAG: hypothetical protein HUU47_02930, partial [Bacteroidetes bacterium]|nr:hypothetical protein [Bacteroidota bacterium]
MIKKYLLIVFLFFICNISFSQISSKEANIWYFGDGNGLDFNNNPPTLLSNYKLSNTLSSASIADSSGKLLFYTNGYVVLNKNHDTMKNGVGLNGIMTPNFFNSTIIIKAPESNRFYYIFSCDNPESFWGYTNQGVCYSVVDMQADSGRGAVVIKKKQILNNSYGKIAAVLHYNKKDVWIATYKKNSDTLFLFLLTKIGISKVVYNKVSLNSSWLSGQAKFSPDGKYFATYLCANNHHDTLDLSCKEFIALYSFCNKTGIVKNEKLILSSNTTHYNYGIEFSPNSKLLYLLSYKNSKTNFGLYQLEINKLSSKNIVDTTYFFSKDFHAELLQLAPNGKIYTSTIYNDTLNAVINFPNLLGSSCNVKKISINSNGNLSFLYKHGLPTFMSSYFHKENFVLSSTCIGKPARFAFLDSLYADSVIWNFGDTASGFLNHSKNTGSVEHTYKNYGNYKVLLITFYDNRSDTQQFFISFPKPNINFEANDVCENDSVSFNNLTPSDFAKSFKWRFGDGNSSLVSSPKHFYKINGISNSYNV